MKERIGYYDIARGMGIIFVVIGHIDSFYMPFRSYVIAFHMALFLIISGMLIGETGEENRSMSAVIGKKIRTIMLPYFLFSLLSVIIEGIRLLASGIFYWPHLRSLLVTTLTLQGNSVMWFLPALFFSELFFLAIRKFSVCICGDKKKIAADILTIVLVLLFVGCVVWSNIFELSFYAGRTGIEVYERLHEVLSMLIRSCVCTFFVCVGYFVRKYIIPLKITAWGYGTIAVLLLGVCAWINYINPGVDLRALDWGELDIYVISFYITLCVKAFIYLAGAVAGALGIIFLCKTLERFRQHLPFRVLAFFGTNSLIIMATHLDFHILHVSMDAAELINKYVNNSFLYHTCILIFVFAMEAIVILMINRYAPILTGRYKKKKDFS